MLACVAGGLVKKAKKVEIPSVRAKRLGREQGKTACRKTKLFSNSPSTSGREILIGSLNVNQNITGQSSVVLLLVPGSYQYFAKSEQKGKQEIGILSRIPLKTVFPRKTMYFCVFKSKQHTAAPKGAVSK